jgi:GNAT superfamily N-acetyltransferase
MPLIFDVLAPGYSFATRELQDRAGSGDWSEPARRAYRVLDRETEVAFIGFDLWSPRELTLYEVYVLPAYQGRGFGTEILDFAKALGKSRNDRRLLVRPRSLSDPPRDVVPFYLKGGFRWAQEDTELLEYVFDDAT